MSVKRGSGKIIIPGGMSPPETHELATADIFARAGMDVMFIKPSQIKGSKTADVMLDGERWEIKSPIGRSKYTVQNQFKRDAKQSKNMIFDARRMSLPNQRIQDEVAKQFVLRRSINQLKFIAKSGAIIDFHK